MKKILSLLCLPLLLLGGDYDFDMQGIEVKPYTFAGYLRGDFRYITLNDESPKYPTKNKESMQSYNGEADVKFAYFEDNYKINSEVFANYTDVDGNVTKSADFMQLYGEYKFNVNHLVEIGKKAPKWGKGYFVNPIAFFDRKKNPDDPEASREGFIFANYRFNKSYDSDVKNITFDLLVLNNEDALNKKFMMEQGTHVGMKLYMLYLDTDIEFLYLYSSSDEDRVGFDFSKNIETNFEIHGEFSSALSGDVKYLLGFKYLSATDLTLTSEYFYQQNQSELSEPFFDKQYFINKLSQKEPLDILYSALYYKNIYNFEDASMQNSVGAIYSFKNDMVLDCSLYHNSGEVKSEFGSKLAQSTFWTRLTWYF